jgi:hypothetical protein
MKFLLIVVLTSLNLCELDCLIGESVIVGYS